MKALLAAVGLLGSLGVVSAGNAQTGSIEGRVVRAGSGEPLPGVEVRLSRSDRGTIADGEGRFRFADVASGMRTIAVRGLGHRAEERTIQVGIGQTVQVVVELAEEAVRLGGITVVGRRGGVVAAASAAATKSDAPLLETPQSISVVTSAQLALRDVGTLAEAARYTPGIQAEPWGLEPRLTFIQIRGFDATTTGLFRDGLQLRNPGWAVGYNLEPYGAERIEMVRGPASVLYGAGSPGGLVNYVTKRPTRVPVREVELETGSHDLLQGKFDVGGPLGEDGVFGYRLTGLVREAGTQIDYVGNDRIFIAPTLVWQPREGTSLTLLGHYTRDETRSSQALPAAGLLERNPHGGIPANRFTGEPDVDRYDRIDYTAGYILEHALGESWTLRQNLRYYDIDLDDVTVYTTGLQEDQRTIDRAIFGSFGESQALGVDNQAHVDFRTGALAHSLLAGLDYQRTDAGSLQRYGSAPPLDVFDPEYGQAVPEPPVFLDNATDQRQLGVYLQNRVELGERWVVSLAGRHDWASTRTRDHLAESTTEQEDRAFTLRGGLVYRSSLGLAPYVSYSESFLPALGTDASGAAFEPETGRQYEVGLKYEPCGWNGFVTVSLFDLARKNFLQYDPETIMQVQTGEVDSRGVEVEAVAGLASGLDVVAAFTQLDVEVTRSGDPAELGKRPAQVPERTASLWAAYSVFPGALSGLGVGAGVRHVGSTYGDAYNTVEVPSVTLADAAVYYDWRSVRLSVHAQNLLDKRYVASAFARNTLLATFGPARTVTASLRYRW